MPETSLPNVFSANFWRELWLDIQLAWRLARDPRVPARSKAILVLLVLYLLTPIDLIPEFLPILGQLDDLVVLVFCLRTFLRLAPEEIVREHRHALGLPA